MKKFFETLLVASGLCVIFLNGQQAKAARINLHLNRTSYLQKGNNYHLHLNVPGRVILTTKARYKILNTSDWRCIPYTGSKKYARVFYLRAGNYELMNKNNSKKKVSITFTKLTKLQRNLDTYPISRHEYSPNNPDQIEPNQKVKGMLDMFKTYRDDDVHAYLFTINRPQRLTINLSTRPVYAQSKTNIFSNTGVEITPVTEFMYGPTNWKVKGKVTNKQHHWYLAQGTYVLEVAGLRGQFNFTFNGNPTDQVPTQNKITKLSPLSNGLQVDYTQSQNATGYEVYEDPLSRPKSKFFNFNFANGINVLWKNYPDTTSQIIPGNVLVNGDSYRISTRGVNNVNGHVYGSNSTPVDYTYYVPLKGSKTIPNVPVLTATYYDDNGGDEPAIELKWPKVDNADSYEVAYRQQGENEWHHEFIKTTGDELDGANDKDNVLYFIKGKVYELKVRALHSYLMSPWSDMKTVRVDRNPAR